MLLAPSSGCWVGMKGCCLVAQRGRHTTHNAAACNDAPLQALVVLPTGKNEGRITRMLLTRFQRAPGQRSAQAVHHCEHSAAAVWLWLMRCCEASAGNHPLHRALVGHHPRVPTCLHPPVASTDMSDLAPKIHTCVCMLPMHAPSQALARL